MSASHSVRRNRIMWALAALLLLLVGSIALIQTQSTPPTLETREAETVFLIKIEHAGSDPIVIERNNGWHITEPVKIAANPQRVTPLLTVYTNNDPGYALDAVDLESTGLTSPKATISFDGYEVKIGDVAIDGTKRHAIHGDRVRFVPDWVLPLIQGGVSAFADLTVWGESLESIHFSRGERITGKFLSSIRSITAQQYVTWPRENPPDIADTHFLEVSRDGEIEQWTIHATDRYAAILENGSNYAYIVPYEELSWFDFIQP